MTNKIMGILLPEEEHRKVKQVAFNRGTTISNYVREALRPRLEEDYAEVEEKAIRSYMKWQEEQLGVMRYV